MRPIRPDGNPDLVWLNKEYRDRDGVTRLYDLSAAKFDIVLTSARATRPSARKQRSQ